MAEIQNQQDLLNSYSKKQWLRQCLDDLLQKQEVYWAQKARQKWL